MKTLIRFLLGAVIVIFIFGHTLRLQAGEKPEYLASFDLAKGFKTAQSDLTEVFLQLAGSLEYYGSPEPYLRHTKAEHERIEAKYRQRFGVESKSKAYWPEFMNDEYFQKFAGNWNHLAPPLALESLTKNTGKLMYNAINGDSLSKATLIGIFNQHQARTYSMLTDKGKEPADFDVLKTELITSLALDQPTAQNRNEILLPELAAISVNLRSGFFRVFDALDAGLKSADSVRVKAFLTGVCVDVGRAAQSELELAILEHALDRQTSGPAKADEYTPDQETALTASERKTFAAFLKKKRFTREDFAALDKFYASAYDKLSERGKDEMSRRFWGGIHGSH